MNKKNLLLLGGAILAISLFAKKKNSNAVVESNIGATDKYGALWFLENNGVDIFKDFYRMTHDEISLLITAGKKYGYKQSSSSKNDGISYPRAFQYFLQRVANKQ